MADENQRIRIALAGNPNCGKTTIFNNITGAKQHVGNYSGVTVEKKEGEKHFEGKDLLFIDLPGTYSLTARSMDELVARNVIINDEPDVIVNVLDASNLERNLYLAAQLVELERPMVIALNMADVADTMGFKYDIDKLSALTGASIVSTVGRDNKGTKELLEAVVKVAAEQEVPPVKVSYGDILEPKIAEVQAELEKAGSVQYPVRYVAIKLLENDADMIGKVMRLDNTETAVAKAKAIREELKNQVDLEVVFQEARHRFAVEVFNAIALKQPKTSETFSDKIDKVITNKYLGIPIFLIVMWVLFTLVNIIGKVPQDWITDGFTALGGFIGDNMADGFAKSLIVDGIIAGVGTVLSFFPLIVLLFLGISFLEDTGYMARAAFVIDRLMHKFGLHGKSFIPLLLGFGCTVPAVMGTRILDNYKDRMVTILVSPFMICSARFPVYILFTAAFFPPEQRGTALFAFYILGIILAIIVAKIFRKTLFKGEAEPFVMELPPYHMPTLKAALQHMWERSVLYVKKAGTFILAANVIVWALLAFPTLTDEEQGAFDDQKAQVEATYEAKNDQVPAQFGLTEEQQAKVNDLVDQMEGIKKDADDAADDAGEDAPEIDTSDDADLPDLFAGVKFDNNVERDAAWTIVRNDLNKEAELGDIDDQAKSQQVQNSYAASIGKFVEPAIKPLGFDWRLGVGIVAFTVAKEVIISTLAQIYALEADDQHQTNLIDFLQNDPDYTPLKAVSLLVFVLIFPPCMAALAVVKRETNSWKWMAFMFCYGVILSWVFAFITYQGGLLLGFK